MAQVTLTAEQKHVIDDTMNRLFRIAGLQENWFAFSFGDQIDDQTNVVTSGLTGSAPATGGVAIYVDNTTPQTSGKVFSMRTGGTEVASVDFAGSITSLAPAGSNALTATAGALVSLNTGYNLKYNTSSTSLDIIANVAAGTSKTAVAINNTTQQSTGKVLSLRSGGVELSYFDYLGALTLPSFTATGTNSIINGYLYMKTGTPWAFTAPTAGSLILNNGTTTSPRIVFADGANTNMAIINNVNGLTVYTDLGEGGFGNVHSSFDRTGIFTVFNNTIQAPGGVAINTSLALSGATLNISTAGGAAIAGQATLVGGTKTISTTAVTASSLIFLSRAGGGVLANYGGVYVSTITAATSFVITSDNALDTQKINWLIVN